LVELLIVIMIIGILMAIGLGTYGNARTTAKRTKARDMARQIVHGWNLYLQEIREFPDIPDKDPKLPDWQHKTTVPNLRVLNASRVYFEVADKDLEVKPADVDQVAGLKDPWGQLYYVALDCEKKSSRCEPYDGLIQDPRGGLSATNTDIRASVIAWSISEKPGRMDRWIVQY
jgi:type II secretory pathway pseudopilin PulG